MAYSAENDGIPQRDLDHVRCRGGCANRLSTGPWHKGLYNLVSAQGLHQPPEETGRLETERCKRPNSSPRRMLPFCENLQNVWT